MGGGPRKVDDLPTSPINQFRDYFIRNRIEQLVPVNYRFPTGNKKTSKQIDQTVFKLDFWQKSGFPKIRELSPVAPRGFYISRNDPNKKKSGNAGQHQKSSFFDKMATFLYAFISFISIFKELDIQRTGFQRTGFQRTGDPSMNSLLDLEFIVGS